MAKDLTLTDFRMAAFLVARGAKFLGAQANGGPEVEFYFDTGEDGRHPEAILAEYPGSPEHRYESANQLMLGFVRMAQRKKSRPTR